MPNILRPLLLGTLVSFLTYCLSGPQPFGPHIPRQVSSNSTLANSTTTHPTNADTSHANSTASACPKMLVRREWRTIPREGKASYINAIKCLTKKPSKLLGKGYRRFDDFQYVHCEMRQKIHFTSKFLPWHHKFTLTWETVLREECSYGAGLPYWDWAEDAQDFRNSPLFSPDPEIGLGTNGANFSYDPSHLGGGIVQDGAFANFSILYPDRQYLERNFALADIFVRKGYTWGGQYYDKAAMEWILSLNDYIKFSNALEGFNPSTSPENYPGPHGMLHSLLGGDMPKLAYAANDMIFYILHCNVDRVWWQWISKDPAKRTLAFNGNRNPGEDKNDASLDDLLEYKGLTPAVKVRDVMKWRQPPYCYEFA